MDGIHPHFTLKTSFSLLLVILLQTPAEAQTQCTAPTTVDFAENNAVGAVVVAIEAKPEVTITFQSENPKYPFKIDGHNLLAEKILDYETMVDKTFTVKLTCTGTTGQLNIIIIVILLNLNDNPPNFEKSLYTIDVNEMSPVNSVVGNIPAVDLDGPRLNYRLTPESSGFKLKSVSNPEILIQTPLDHEKVKEVRLTLYAEDGPLTSTDPGVASTASTTIMVTIKDGDNRPPWFRPCNELEIEGVLICQSKGYTGKVFFNQTEPGTVTLKPGPVYAIDGDVDINETIIYSFLSGNEDGLFNIHPNTGTITMLKVANVLKTITLIVMAAQTVNRYQFATTTATISVVMPSLHPPRFQKNAYAGIISGVGVIAKDATKNQPLVILATDDDYTATGGLNPHITYQISGSNDFSILNSYLFMMKELPEATLALQVLAVDTSNQQSATAQLSVEVTSGVTTTTVSLSTTTPIGVSTTSSKTTEATGSTSKPSTSTDSIVSTTLPSVPTTTVPPSTTTSIGVSTTSSKTTETIGSTSRPSTSTDSGVSTTLPSVTSENTVTTTNSITSTEGSTTQPPTGITTTPADGAATTSGGEATTTKEGGVSTITPSLTSGGGEPTPSTAYPHTEIPLSGGYRMEEMAALGASLGVILFICMVVIGVLFFYIRRGKADWKKIYETSMFRSSLGQGPGAQKEVIQYTNNAFQNDDDGDSSSGGPQGRTVAGELRAGEDPPHYEYIARTPLQGLPRDDTSQAGSDRSDNDKDVRPILTRERRIDEGYKSVWFKEDIDPNAKEEVVIIPNNKDNDSDEEDGEQPSSSREEDEAKDLQRQRPRAVFNDVDLDSGLGVKMDDPAEDSDGDDALSADL